MTLWLQEIMNRTMNVLSTLKLTDLIDVLLVSFLVYKALKWVRDTKTVQLLKGLAFVIIATQICQVMNLFTIHYILDNFLQLGIIALIIVFQPELRRLLEQAGRTTNKKWFTSQSDESAAESQQVIREVSKAAHMMSNTRTGALIVIENSDNIDPLISSGVKVSAVVTAELLENIFVPDTPLHDGAVVIRNHKVELASCVLPLSKNPDIKTSYGTRHRAGIGVSEESDAIAVIVSEETGRISLAYKGELTLGYTDVTLRTKLNEIISYDEEEEKTIFKLPNLSKRRRD